MDDWGTLLTVLLVLDIIISAVAAYLISKHHKDTLAARTTHGTTATDPRNGGRTTP